MPGAGGAVGGAFQLIGALGKYSVSQNLAREEQERADKLRNEAGQVKAPPLRQEFRDVQRLKNLNTLNGIPGYAQYGEDINQQTANQLAVGRDAATSGSDLLSYATSTYAAGNDAMRKLKLDDVAYRANALQDYANTQWSVGDEELKNDAIKRQDQKELLAQSGALENAATANKWQGKSDAIGESTDALASIAGGLAGGGGGMGGGAGGGSGAGGLAGAQMGGMAGMSGDAGGGARKTTLATGQTGTGDDMDAQIQELMAMGYDYNEAYRILLKRNRR